MAASTNGTAPKWDKVILVTGGAGFIASHVVIRLVKNYPNYKIINFDKLDYCACIENVEVEVGHYPNYKFIKGNLTSPDLVNHVMDHEEIDTVMHFAAQTHVDNSFGNSFQFTENNVMGTHVLIESAKVHDIKLFVHVSTDEVYGEGAEDENEMTEEHVLEPTNPYAATKAAAEFIVKSYHRSFKLPVVITRGNNVYGPHQYPEKMIPKFVNQLLRGRPVTLHGDGSNTRNFLYVTDVAAAFDTILHKSKPGQIYNIGGSNELPNVTVAKTIIEKMGLKDKESVLLTFVEDRCFNDLRYTIDNSKLEALGWREETSWDDGLQMTIDWYKKHTNRYKNIESALVAHPRQGATNDSDYVAAKKRKREQAK